ncbi:hypothetical protein F3Y22_tig00013960pilonHSYRG00242 [Hibiscus syriacus]|uniref:Pentatricopeptide repeat-containing protein n=1 Tax=Hibiscus syriacus TaxID=106335 RepID=A0A6A3C0F4_HIBSY|nr:hypothetical protein F3Y22_tig00013960pilonHSYRG00242 [Hibiscus syriacus]
MHAQRPKRSPCTRGDQGSVWGDWGDRAMHSGRPRIGSCMGHSGRPRMTKDRFMHGEIGAKNQSRAAAGKERWTPGVHGDLCWSSSTSQKISGLEIDEFAYAAVLHVCVTSCNVDVGVSYFNRIKKPTVTHRLLMIALLARTGHFDEVCTFIEEHRIENTADVLRAVLDGCRIYQQVTMGKRIVEQLCELEPLNAENYILLSNWHAENGKWDMVEKLKTTIKDMGAYGWIEFRNKVHVLGTGDVSHPRSEMIYRELQHLMNKRKTEEDMSLSRNLASMMSTKNANVFGSGIVGCSPLLLGLSVHKKEQLFV